MLQEFSMFLSEHNFQAHVLKDGIYLQLEFNSRLETDLLTLDKLTSTVIMNGGSLRPNNRQTMDRISPYLAKRVLGEHNLPLQTQIKLIFDPNAVLEGDGQMFYPKADRAKSFVQKLREKNKQINFYLSKF